MNPSDKITPRKPTRYSRKPIPPQRRKPYIDPLRKKKPMTIAAGFCCSDGVVLCADTQFTVPGTMKYPESKLRMTKDLKCLPFFAFCGNMDFQKQCSTAFSNAIQEAERDKTSIVDALEKIALEMHTAYYDAYSEPELKLQATMFISVLLQDRRELYKIHGPKVARVDTLDCLGSGSYLARALADSYRNPGSTMYRTALASVFILSDVKKYVDGCGGDSQIVCLGHDGSWSFFSEDDFRRTLPITEIEQHYQTWRKRVGFLLMDFLDLQLSQIDFEIGITNLQQSMVDSRASQAKLFDQIEEWEWEQMLNEAKEARKVEEGKS